jgi:cyclomaltodextrinase
MEWKAQVQTPDWVKDAIFYQIFPDRFARSTRLSKPVGLEDWDSPVSERGFKGGDLLGVVERLDYLSDLGISALYFNPIFQSATNHRYHTFDYYHVDPLLGGNDAFRVLIDEAHQRGIRVVLDGVFNHAGRGFFPFNHVLENETASIYYDWFIIHGFPLHAYESDQPAQYACWWGLRELPKLNTDNPAVRRYILDVAAHWLRFGIDGWRLDVPLEIRTPGFWEEFRTVAKGVKPEAHILAEIWDDAPEWLSGDRFDATMNYRFNRACLGFFGADDLEMSVQPGGFPLCQLDGPAFANELEEMLDLYHWETTQVQLNLLSSHDEPRFLAMVRGNKDRLRLATLFQMTFPGAPCVYYGDEIGMCGGIEGEVCSRGSFPWQESVWDGRLRGDFRAFVALRKAHPAFRRGEFRVLQAVGSGFSFLRRDSSELLVCCFNSGKAAQQVSFDLSPWLHSSSQLRDIWTGEVNQPADGRLALNLEPLSARVLIA